MKKVSKWVFEKYPTFGKKLQPSEISSGTLQCGDILEAIFEHFAPYDSRAPKGFAAALSRFKSWRQYQRGTFDAEMWQDETEHLFAVIDRVDWWATSNDLFLPGHYIGFLEGNGSAFGIWWDGTTVDYPVFDEKPDGRQSEAYYVVNERGNTTFYTRTGKTVFSYV